MTMTLERKVAIRSEMRKLLNVVNANENLFVNLADRWACERDYEDINDYAIPLRPLLAKKDFTIVKMLRRPFGFTAKSVDGVFRVTVGKTRFRVTHIGG